MKVYEQARAFERLRSWRLPLCYAVFPLVPVLIGGAAWAMGRTMAAWVCLMAGILLTWLMWWQWRTLRARHAENLRVLAELKKTYGPELPWIEMENHFAELEKLKRTSERQ